MSFDFSTLITNRAASDLENLRALLSTPMEDWTAEQLAEFNLARSKGAYNASDLNRVTQCMDYLNERLTEAGYVTGYQKVTVPHAEPTPVGPLPEGYTELEYIESTGTQWIDTDFSPKNTTRIVMAIDLSSSVDYKGVFGGRTSGSSAFYCLWQSPTGFRYDFYNTQTAVNRTNGGRFTLEINNGALLINSSQAASPGGGSFTSTATLVLLSVATGQGTSDIDERMAVCKLYSCQIYDNGILIREFVPCKNPSGVVGLYDTVGATFYGNSGSGAFTAGPEVSTPTPGGNPDPDPTKDPYTWYEDDIHTASLMRKYLANVTNLRGTISLPENTPAVPGDMDGLTLAEANAIEEILDVLNTYLLALEAIFLRSGMSWAVSGGPRFYFEN